MEMIAKFQNGRWLLVAMVNGKKEEFLDETLAGACRLLSIVKGDAK